MYADKAEKVDPTKYKYGIKPALRLTGFLGFCAGFMLAYQQSSCELIFNANGLYLVSDQIVRFWGTRENAREVEKDQRELSELAKAGKLVYGDTDMSEYLQGVASRNSTWSQLKLHAMPW
jgi:hypothetical protein